MTVTGRALGAVDLRALDDDIARAVEGVGHFDLVLLQRHGEGEDLEGRAGLEGVVDGLVAPLHILQRVGRRGELLVGHAGGKHLLVVNARGSVEVVGRQRRHREDAAGVDVHDDAGRAHARAVAALELLKALFEVILHRLIEGRHQTVAVLGVEILLILIEERVAVGVARGDDHALFAGQLLVIHSLKAVGAAVGVDKADDVRGERGIGVVALGGRLQKDAFDVVVADKHADFVRRLLLDLLLDDLVLRGGVLHIVEDAARVHAEDLAEAVCDQVLILLVFGDVERRDADVLRRGGEGEDVAVFIVDGAAARLHGRAQRLLAHGERLELVVLLDLQLVELGKEQQKRADAQQRQQQKRPLLDDAVGAARAVRFSFRGCRHGLSSSYGKGHNGKTRSKEAPYSLCIGFAQLKYSTTLKTPCPSEVNTRLSTLTFCASQSSTLSGAERSM